MNLALRRLLVFWVLLSQLGYGTAWAWDIHDSARNVNVDVSAQSVTSVPDSLGDTVPDVSFGASVHASSDAIADAGPGSLPAEHDSSPDCDHCCHGLSHLLGLSRNLSVLARPAADSVHLPPAVLFDSRVPSPDLRPPIV